MALAGEVVPLNEDGTIPEGSLYNPAAGVATVIPGGILDTGVSINTTPSNTFTNLLNTTTGVTAGATTAPAGSFEFYKNLADSGFYDDQTTATQPTATQPTVPQTTLEAMQGVYVDNLGVNLPRNVLVLRNQAFWDGLLSVNS